MKQFAVIPGFEVGGSLFRPEQLAALGTIVGKDTKIELTSFQQLYIEIEEEQADEIGQKLKEHGLLIYPVGAYVKSLRTCSFCKGAEEEGLHVAVALNDAVAGQAVPRSMKIGYTGCTNACGDPLTQDIGVVKNKDVFDVYIGGVSQSLEPAFGQLFIQGVPEEKLNGEIQKIISFYVKNGKKREAFSRFIKRVSIEGIREGCK
jgi:precorrin-3B C17-methyltransferase